MPALSETQSMGKSHLKTTSSTLKAGNVDFPVMGGTDCLHDGKPQPGTAQKGIYLVSHPIIISMVVRRT